jgi:hypothetical protein
LPSSRMPGNPNSSGARLAVKVQSSQCSDKQYNRVSPVQTWYRCGESSKEGLYLLFEPVCQRQVDWGLMTFIYRYVQFCDFSKFTFFHLLWLYLWLFKGKFCDYMWWIVTF